MKLIVNVFSVEVIKGDDICVERYVEVLYSDVLCSIGRINISSS